MKNKRADFEANHIAVALRGVHQKPENIPAEIRDDAHQPMTARARCNLCFIRHGSRSIDDWRDVGKYKKSMVTTFFSIGAHSRFYAIVDP
jgi:hypothetical protein